MRNLILSACLFATPALAQEPLCLPYADMKGAAEANGAQPIVRGLQSDGLILELYDTEDGEWIAIVVSPTGVACLVMSGVAFAILPQGERM